MRLSFCRGLVVAAAVTVVAATTGCGGGGSAARLPAVTGSGTAASEGSEGSPAPGPSGADDPSEPSPDPAPPDGAGAAAAPSIPPAPPAVPPSAAPAADAVGAGPGLVASGGWSGHITGKFRCGGTGDGAVLTLEGSAQLVIRAEGGRVVSASYSGERVFGGSPAGGLPGSLTVSDRRATVKGVGLPASAGGAPLRLDGTVTCS